MNNLISIVVSLYNEDGGVVAFWESLNPVLEQLKQNRFEVIWVNDGSTDNTQEILQGITKDQNEQVAHHVLELSKNFGHEAAMIAGVDYAKGDAIVCMDGDGQHPAKMLPEMISAYNQGHDIVLMNNTVTVGTSKFRQIFTNVFYKLINYLSTIKFEQNSSDFYLISTQVGSLLKSNYREQSRFLRGFIQSVGFSSKVLPFEAEERKNGVSSYSVMSLIKLALNAIFTFSFKPLRISIFFSVIFILFTFLFILYSLYEYFYGEKTPSGYTTVVIFLSFSFSLLFLTLTVLSLYIEKTIQEMRQRPIYIVKKRRDNSDQ
jgi:glycosyltransferase involved in cell wall biosynthesis